MILVDVFKLNDKLFAWINDGDNSFYEINFFPKLYVYGKNMKTIQKILGGKRIDSYFQKRKTLHGFRTVLCVPCNIGARAFVVNLLKQYSCEIFHADLSLEEYYLFQNNLFPTCRVDAVLDKFNRIIAMSTKDQPFQESDKLNLQTCTIKLKTTHSVRTQKAELISIVYNDTPHTMQSFIKKFADDDPDIIIANNHELIFILNKIRKKHPDFSFSRFGKDYFSQKGQTYTSYGSTIFKDPATYLKGRLHFRKTGTLYGSWTLDYPFELARICRTPLQKANHRSIGYGVASLQQYTAMRLGYLIPYKTGYVERWRTALDLFDADRGALIYEPEIGFHTNTAEIDFISLYPSIMVKYNISPETVFCRCCKQNIVPDFEMNICRNKIGIMPIILEPIIKQRQEDKIHAPDRANALKGLLVTSFGYMGFRKSKFARIECHQAILAYARETLLNATKIAEELGFKVIHGIVDSLWVKGDMSKVPELIAAITERIGLPIKLEGYYKWIVFLPSIIHSDLPVPTRYYGVFSDGEIKCRGIEVRRRDTCKLVKDMQMNVIEMLSKAECEKEFRELMKESSMYLQQTLARLLQGQVTFDELSITKRISKLDYSANIAQKQIINQLQKSGFTPEAGQYIKYVTTGNGYSSNPDSYSLKEYVKLAKRAYKNLFIPFKTTLTLNDYQGTAAKKLPIQIKERIGRKVS